MKSITSKRYFFIFLFIFYSSICIGDSLKIAYVDLMRALNEVEEGIQEKNKFTKELAIRQKIFNNKREQITKLSEEFEKQNSIMIEEIKQKKLQNIQILNREIQNLYGSMQRYIMEQQQNITGKIFKKMSLIINKIAQKGQYTYILNGTETTVLYGKSQWDLTNEVIRKYNETYKNIANIKK